MNSGQRSRAPLPRRQTKIKRDCRIFFQIAVKLLMIESMISVKTIMSIKAVAFQLLKGLSALTGAPYGSQNDDMVVRYGILHAEVAFLQKPFTIGTLAKRIRDLLDQR